MSGSIGSNDDDDDDDRQPLVGILFSFICNEFIPNNGGLEEFDGLTTEQVKERFIVPATKQRREYYWDLLCRRCQGHDHDHPTGPCSTTASAFISHAHSYIFLDVINALQHYLLQQRSNDEDDGESPYIFFDIFCINQHRTNWSHEFLSKTIMSSIKQFRRTVVVMSPWNDPLPFTRAWCVYEAYCASVTNSKYEIALSKNERQKFLNALRNGKPKHEIDQMLGNIQSERSVASNEEDRHMIHSIIRESIGFAKLDSIVFEQYRNWVIDTSLDALNQCNDDDDKPDNQKQRADLLHIVGSMYWRQGSFDNALHYMSQAIEQAKTSYGEFSARHLRCMNNLAGLYYYVEEFDHSEELYIECLKHRKLELGDDHPDTLSSMCNLGRLYSRKGQYDKALPLLKECYEMRQAKLTTDEGAAACTTIPQFYKDHLGCIHSLGTLYYRRGDFPKAERLYVDCLEKRRHRLGLDHPQTLTSMKRLAVLYYEKGEYDKAESLLMECLEKRMIKLGCNHPETLECIDDLSKLYKDQGQHEKAKALLRLPDGAHVLSRPDETFFCSGARITT